ncbi:E3 ubiquitin-protein ligase PRT1-like isoform X1 [Papaver somniferum]|uniref:E3 ubiquitin-protein ligase PRT1-like isoform X1 n=1 Tax=Papaver somniferum TaxID=3469 RepID=UPI000E6F8F8B|nr:E3 ubiquitin-protein ligase PRT1-like isoform X1 [Papaver somniferum]
MEDKTQLKPANDSPSLHEVQTLDDSSDEGEEINESFVCCICLELLHKPIVLACGHVSCFWCVHHAMDFGRESHCPICRREYNHFPSICELLHFLLLKMYRETYRRREMQLLEVEKMRGVFSPQLDQSSSCLDSEPKAPHPPPNSISCSQSISCHETNSSVKTYPAPIGNSPEKCAENSVRTKNVNTEENTYLNYEACQRVSINDALCITCKQMLLQPVILNCGHAYCESCLEIPEHEALSCQLCQFPHPNGFPKVCLVLDNFLETEFPQEYARRREDVQHKLVRSQQGTAASACTTSSKKDGPLSSTKLSQYYSEWMRGAGPDIHFAAGCDYCGVECPSPRWRVLQRNSNSVRYVQSLAKEHCKHKKSVVKTILCHRLLLS